MDMLELIKSRRSFRKYQPKPISEEEMDKILEAGRWAPSAGNSQPWKFIVLRNAEVRKALADAVPTGRFISSAPVAIVVTINPRASSHPVEDGAAATQNMLLEAHSLGLGACWIGGASGTANEERAKRILNIPEEERLLSIISVGHPAESPEKSRRSMGETTFTDSYGSH